MEIRKRSAKPYQLCIDRIKIIGSDSMIKKIRQKIKELGYLRFGIEVVKRMPMLIVGLIGCLIIKGLRPIVFIRLGSFYADRIGPLLTRSGLYMMEKDHQVQPQNTVDIFHDGYGNDFHICNHQLLKMYQRVFRTRKGVYLSNWFIKRT